MPEKPFTEFERALLARLDGDQDILREFLIAKLNLLWALGMIARAKTEMGSYVFTLTDKGCAALTEELE
jgi:hypothetical protein